MSITAAFTTMFSIGRVRKDSVDSAGYLKPLVWSTSYVAYGYMESNRYPRETVSQGDPEAVNTFRMFFLNTVEGHPMDLHENMEAAVGSAFVYSAHKSTSRYRFLMTEFIKGHHWEVEAKKVDPNG